MDVFLHYKLHTVMECHREQGEQEEGVWKMVCEVGEVVEQVALEPLSIVLAGFQGSQEVLSHLALATIPHTSEVAAAGHYENVREVRQCVTWLYTIK